MLLPRFFARTFLFACALFAGLLPSASPAQAINPYIAGNNLWYADRTLASTTPSSSVMTLTSQAGIRFIRIGGKEFDKNLPSNAALLTWVNRIRAIGAEPLVQISQYNSAATAAATVTYLNVTNNANVRYWSIGNEPWLQANQSADAAGTARPTESEIAATIATYFKARSAAMKAVDPTIKIFGVDSEDFQPGLHARLFGGANNIAGKIPGQNYYYCDGLSWHRYPQANNIDPAYEGLNDIRTRVEDCRDLIDATNLSQARTGADALQWAIGEFNAKNGAAVHTWGAGQMFAGVYGLAMKHGATFATAWSLRESEGLRPSTDFGLLDGAGQIPRPTYWHTQFVAQNFSGTYLEGYPSISDATSDLLVYGASDPVAGKVSVLILNRGTSAQPYTLHLNATDSFAAPGAVSLNIDAASNEAYSDTIPARGTHVIVFRTASITRTSYCDADFAITRAPQTTVTARPATNLIDAFDAYTDLAQQSYWSTQNINGGLASLAAGSLVLRTSNTGYSTAAIASPVSSNYNFFNRGFTLGLTGFVQSSSDLTASATHFRLSLNSTAERSFRAADSLALRITPVEVRLGFKVNQLDVQGELRAGTATTDAFLLTAPYTGALRSLRLSLEPDPAGPVGGVSTITYSLQLDGVFGRILKTGTFTAAVADWGAAGDSALVFESRRESANTGAAGSYAEARIDQLTSHPRLIDDFDVYAAFSGQSYWQTLFAGANSTAQVAAGSAVLLARADAFGSAAIASPVSSDFNFFTRGGTVELRNLALSAPNLTADQSVFRLSFNSTAERSFGTPDSVTLRLNPNRLRLGYKLDQTATDAEFRTGVAATVSSLIDLPLDPAQPVTGVRLTLTPVGTATAPATILYALRLTGAFGAKAYSGTFTADLSRWGAAGDSALVIEARRNSGTASTNTSSMQATLGSVVFTPIPDDLFTEAPCFTSYRLRNFATEELAAPATSGTSATPAGDGVSNILKYAFGLEAKNPANPGLLPSASLDTNGVFTLAHEERFGAADLTYATEASTDLLTWTTPVIETSRSNVVDGFSVVTARADLAPGAPRVFLRVKVTSPAAP